LKDFKRRIYSMIERIAEDVKKLCSETRHPGSAGNMNACAYAAKRFRESGLEVYEEEFSCMDWEDGACSLSLEGANLDAKTSPYSLSCSYEGPYVTAGSIDELEERNFTGMAVVLHGDLCKEQLAPKNFVFYNPDEHKRIVSLLEEKQPSAIIAVTSENPELAGAVYPFPLIEDGDFDIPSVYMTEEEGQKLLKNTDKPIKLSIKARRIPSRGRNIIARVNGKAAEKIVFCAHIDAKQSTPGALDNATGVAVLLALGELIKDCKGKYCIELLAINGEDYYAASGQMLYLKNNPDLADKVKLCINIDAAGCKEQKSSVCFFDLDKETERILRNIFSEDEGFVMIEPWYQGDHMVFVMNGVPAAAVSSENLFEILTEIAHTEKDIPDISDAGVLYNIALNFKKLVVALSKE
jgi:aminopeptidase YwaD